MKKILINSQHNKVTPPLLFRFLSYADGNARIRMHHRYSRYLTQADLRTMLKALRVGTWEIPTGKSAVLRLEQLPAALIARMTSEIQQHLKKQSHASGRD